jgi:hypothetical protein
LGTARTGNDVGVEVPSFSYVVPLASSCPLDGTDLTGYLRALGSRCELIVVDGSPAGVFDAHHRAWAASCLHVPPAVRTPAT